jgi:ubiquinone/menaquinone biosynthesis C-methylase UbiE
MKEILEKEYWENVKNAGEVKRDSNHPVVTFFASQRIEYLKKFIDFNDIKNALDVGCGTGFSTSHFPPFIDLIGVDFSLRNLIVAPIKSKIQASAYCLPYSSNTFDLVYGWDFLHHLDSPEKSVIEMARVTKKYLVLFEPNSKNLIQFLYAFSNKNERGTLKFNKNKLLELLDIIQFKLIKCDTVGWTFAGATPKSLLKLNKHLPFSHRMGISNVLICERI